MHIVTYTWSGGESGTREFPTQLEAENWARDLPLREFRQSTDKQKEYVRIWLDGILIHTYDE